MELLHILSSIMTTIIIVEEFVTKEKLGQAISQRNMFILLISLFLCSGLFAILDTVVWESKYFSVLVDSLLISWFLMCLYFTFLLFKKYYFKRSK